MSKGAYKITEPHPTVSKYASAGRGGAGNIFRAPKTTEGSSAQGPASNFDTDLRSSSSKFISGRGGSGNIFDASGRPVFCFEELDRQVTIDNASVGYHVGRGGAGNRASTIPNSSRKGSKNSTSSTDSETSSRSSRLLNRLSQTFGSR